MSALDLTAVCERHGIIVHETTSAVVTGGWMAHYDPAESFDRFGIGASPEEAVCGLLKARWGMTTGRGVFGMWGADNGVESRCADTELAAVAALADRLKVGAA
jgi:hypothetical protein